MLIIQHPNNRNFTPSHTPPPPFSIHYPVSFKNENLPGTVRRSSEITHLHRTGPAGSQASMPLREFSRNELLLSPTLSTIDFKPSLISHHTHGRDVGSNDARLWFMLRAFSELEALYRRFFDNQAVESIRSKGSLKTMHRKEDSWAQLPKSRGFLQLPNPKTPLATPFEKLLLKPSPLPFNSFLPSSPVSHPLQLQRTKPAATKNHLTIPISSTKYFKTQNPSPCLRTSATSSAATRPTSPTQVSLYILQELLLRENLPPVLPSSLSSPLSSPKPQLITITASLPSHRNLRRVQSKLQRSHQRAQRRQGWRRFQRVDRGQGPHPRCCRSQGVRSQALAINLFFLSNPPSLPDRNAVPFPISSRSTDHHDAAQPKTPISPKKRRRTLLPSSRSWRSRIGDVCASTDLRVRGEDKLQNGNGSR